MATRLLVWCVTYGGILEPFVAQDFISFGFILHVAIINEIEHAVRIAKGEKSVQNGIAILLIVCYSTLSAAILVGPDVLEMDKVLLFSTCLATVSLVSGLMAYRWL